VVAQPRQWACTQNSAAKHITSDLGQTKQRERERERKLFVEMFQVKNSCIIERLKGSGVWIMKRVPHSLIIAARVQATDM